jgi:hypothetical protein
MSIKNAIGKMVQSIVGKPVIKPPQKADLILLDIRISGFAADNPSRLLAIVDMNKSAISIEKELSYFGDAIQSGDKDVIVVVDTPAHHKKWDLHFNQDEHMQHAVHCYQDISRQNRVRLNSLVTRFNPASVIQIKKIDASGTVFELDTASISNGHMAAMIAVWAYSRVAMSASLTSAILVDETSDIDGDNDDDDSMMPFSV